MWLISSLQPEWARSVSFRFSKYLVLSSSFRFRLNCILRLNFPFRQSPCISLYINALISPYSNVQLSLTHCTQLGSIPVLLAGVAITCANERGTKYLQRHSDFKFLPASSKSNHPAAPTEQHFFVFVLTAGLPHCLSSVEGSCLFQVGSLAMSCQQKTWQARALKCCQALCRSVGELTRDCVMCPGWFSIRIEMARSARRLTLLSKDIRSVHVWSG